ncbi:uncharacterized protein M421DRAFT_416160, partial [Didymella exigua CBS 183.55]
LANCYINHINKKAFLAALTLVFNQAFLKDNVLSSFRATSLVLDNLEVVLLRLKVKPCTPTLTLPRSTP